VKNKPSWDHVSGDGIVPEHTIVIGGVICRWWGVKEPPGVRILTKLMEIIKEWEDVKE